MIEIRGIKIDFKPTSPTDLKRLYKARDHMIEAGKKYSFEDYTPDAPEFETEYIKVLDAALKLMGDFLDEAFGEGPAMAIMGDNPAIEDIPGIQAEINAAVEASGRELREYMAGFEPNRQTEHRA